VTSPGPVDRRLLEAVVGITEGLEVEPALQRVVRAAADLTSARYAAVALLGDDGLHQAFVHTGLDPATVAAIGPLPAGHGVLGHVTRSRRPLRTDDLTRHPDSVGFPAGHPAMHTFLGVPVGIGERVIGNLYLAGKDAGFSQRDEDLVGALAAAAAVAVDNARRHEAVRRRAAWQEAAQRVTTALLEGAEAEDALELVAHSARTVAGADASALVLPNLGGGWLVEVVDGDGVDDLVGTVMPAGGRTMAVVGSGRGLRLADLGHEPVMQVPALRRFGPALYAPLLAPGGIVGVLLLLRRHGAEPFAAADLATASAFAAQAALTLRLAEGRRRAAEAELLEDRQRIARDLHDLVIQELFALGMRLGRLPVESADIDSSLESLDRVVRQIRATIRALRDPASPAGLADRVHGEVARARNLLGFEPSVELTSDGDPDELVGSDVADDLVAVIREGLTNAARHARPAHVWVTVTITKDTVRAEVADDGAGLPAVVSRRSGLDNLDARARRHGGHGEATRRPGGGTVLVWEVTAT
jgi:signal transduction histidine kinase